MRRKFLQVFLVAMLALCLAFGLAACNNGNDDNGGSGALTLNTATLSLYEGGASGTLNATVAGGGTVTWSNSNDSVVSIKGAGNICIVTPVSQGASTVTATLGDDSATCVVTVGEAPEVEIVAIYYGEEEVTGDTLEVEENQTLTLTATASMGSDITWLSADEAIATVNNGVVTGVRPGTVAITARVSGSIYASVNVKVNAPAGTVYYPLLFGWGGNPDHRTPEQEENDEPGEPIPDNTYYYWASRNGWGQQVDVLQADYRDGTVTVKYTSSWTSEDGFYNGGYYYGFQLLYINSNITVGSYYKYTAKITVDKACTLSIAGVLVDLNQGENDVTVYYQANSNKFTVMTGYDLMDGSNGYFIQEIEFSISDAKWVDDTAMRVQLQAPSFTLDGQNVITITDPNTVGVGGYALNFYDDDGERVASVPVTSGQAVDTSKVMKNGTYTVKLVVLAENAHYKDSAESSTTATIVVDNDSVSYNLEASGATGAVANPGIWTYWKQTWVEIREATYTDGVVTLEFSNNAGNWDAMQLYYRDPSVKVGGTYTFVLEITSDVASKIVISGNNVPIEIGTHTYTIENFVQGKNDATVAMIFAQYNEAGIMPDAHLEISLVSLVETAAAPEQPSENPEDYELGEAILPTDNAMEKNGEGDATPNTFAYWYVEEAIWGLGSVVAMNTATYENGVVTLAYTGGEVDFAVQLFYKNTEMRAGKQYFVFLTLELDSALQVKVNGEIMNLSAGTHELNVLFTNGGTSLSIQFYGVGSNSVTAKVSDISWRQVITGEDAPSVPKDPADYELGAAINPSTAFEKNGEGDATPNTFAYWYVEDASWNCGSVVTMKTATYENGVVTLAYTGGSIDFSVQLFYKNTQMKAGTQYFLFLTLELDSDLQVKINGEVMNLTAGTHTLNVLFTNGGTSLSIQFYGVGSNSVTAKVSNVSWQEVLGNKSNSGNESGNQGGNTPSQPTVPEVPETARTIEVTPTEFYGEVFVKISMSAEDLAYIQSNAAYVVTNGERHAHGSDSGYLVDGNVIQIMYSSANETSFTCYWYDANDNIIAVCTFAK